MENVILTNMCMVYDDNGNVLVQKRRDTDRWPGIAFPGGHIEAGESFTAAVIRKIFEDDSLQELYSYKQNGVWQFDFL